MKVIIVSVYDNTLKTFGKAFQAQSEDDAARSFSCAVVDKESRTMLSMRPQDFELYSLATLDMDTGEVVPAKTLLMSGFNVESKSESSKEERS